MITILPCGKIQCYKADWTIRYYNVLLVEHCIDPGGIENGEMEGTAPFTCISTVKYTCNDGYWLLGAEVLRCGIDGQRDHAKPLCIDKSED